MIFEMTSCGGCKTCAIACSYRHTGEFCPSASNIRIEEKVDGLGFHVCLIDVASADSKEFGCDGCLDLEEPLCLQYCEKSEDLENILRTFLKKGV